MDRDPGDDDAYRAHARQKLDAHLPDRDEKATDALLEHLSYRQADVTSADALRAALEGAATPMAVYLALPNVLFRPTLEALAAADLPAHTTLVVEKPFGADLEDAKALNELIERSFDERDVFRIDHFLAKQTVLDVLGLRFANRIFEPVWNSDHISRVDITWYESLGLEGRANYYDRAGALRDMIQNHLLQMLALVAMDPPRSITERDLRDRKVEALRAVTPPKPEDMAKATRRARYTAGTVGGKDLPAYVDAEGVDPARGHRDLRRGDLPRLELALGAARRSGCAPARRSGRSGGRSPCTSSPCRTSRSTTGTGPTSCASPSPPTPSRSSSTSTARATRSTSSASRSTTTFPTQELPPYSLLLKEILEGDATLSIRGDEAEELWRIVEPVLQAWERDEVPLEEYPAGSGGPKRREGAARSPGPGRGSRSGQGRRGRPAVGVTAGWA